MNNKKTVLQWVLPLFLAIGLCITVQNMVVFAAEDEETSGTTTPCSEHDWLDWRFQSSTEATCKEPGEEIWACVKCGQTKKVRIPAKEIWFYQRTIKYANCNSEGLKEYKCSGCGETKTEVVPKTDKHRWKGSVTKKPTLISKGTYTSRCELCGKTEGTYNLLLGQIVHYANCGKYANLYSTTSTKNSAYIGAIKLNTEVYAFEGVIVDNKFTFTKLYHPSGTTDTAYALSAHVSILTDEKRAPDKVTVVSAKLNKKKKRITVQWEKDSIADGYQITYATNNKFKGKKNINISKNNTLKATIKKVKINKMYYLKVRAYRKVDGKKKYGEYSRLKYVWKNWR